MLDEWAPRWATAGVSTTTQLVVAAAAFIEHLGRSGASANTLAAFAADLRLFCRATGCEQPIGQLTREQIESFYGDLVTGAEARCCSRSLRRRATTLQALFRYLADEGAVDAALTLPVARPPERAEAEPPLSSHEVARLLEAARQASGEGDSRALLLALLVLETGMSKGECLALRSDAFDFLTNTLTLPGSLSRKSRRRTPSGQATAATESAAGPEVGGAVAAVEHSLERQRVLPLSAEAKQAYLSFRQECPGEGTLFSCTGRNLEYVLARAGQRAGLARNPSFRLLRATAASLMLSRGGRPDEVVTALGISATTWPALRRRLRAADADGSTPSPSAPRDGPPISEPGESLCCTPPGS